jgi:hypothetical protein
MLSEADRQKAADILRLLSGFLGVHQAENTLFAAPASHLEPVFEPSFRTARSRHFH